MDAGRHIVYSDFSGGAITFQGGFAPFQWVDPGSPIGEGGHCRGGPGAAKNYRIGAGSNYGAPICAPWGGGSKKKFGTHTPSVELLFSGEPLPYRGRRVSMGAGGHAPPFAPWIRLWVGVQRGWACNLLPTGCCTGPERNTATDVKMPFYMVWCIF